MSLFVINCENKKTSVIEIEFFLTIRGRLLLLLLSGRLDTVTLVVDEDGLLGLAGRRLQLALAVVRLAVRATHRRVHRGTERGTSG